MPQITKLRIVNFQYNDGKRLIADELYDFESQTKGPSDVLINLANGGGKSVLVQLMMQPVIPKARVAGRRIESFFTKSSDHCYVAIEWALDGSKMKLMTGIAMAASDSSRDTDSDRGFQIKYYTFISSYQDYGGSYDIIALPLSRKERGRFVPAAFDDVRNLAKRSGGGLERYASDDSLKWKDRLAQYGIIQNEWRMIEELNSNEDGLSKYFSSLKTSDAVIDKLIIPRIEEKQDHDAPGDDSSLETMLISYAKQFSRQQEIIKERDICSGFYGLLKQTKTDAEDLWKSNDSLEKSIEELFAFSDALGIEIAEKKEQAERLDEEKKAVNERIRHIEWEKVSADYYGCREAFERETVRLQRAQEAKNAAKEKMDAATKNLLLMESAYYYGQLREIENQTAAILAEIASRENNTESSGTLAALKYSAFLAINEERERIEPEMEALSSKRAGLEAEITELSGEIDALAADADKAAAQKIRDEAVYDRLVKENDAMVEALGIGAFRMFDGKYQSSELELWNRETRKKEQDITAAVADNVMQLQRLEESLETIPQKIADVHVQIQRSEEALEGLNGKLDDFREAEGIIRRICERHSLDYGLRFGSHIKDYLTEQMSFADASIADEERKTESVEEAIAAVKRGTLHIPRSLLAFLDGTGVRYTSIEKYLLTQRAEGNLSADDCQRFLTGYPYAAYGVMLDEKDIESLHQDSAGGWLPAVLPIFTQAQLGLLMKGEAPSFSSVAAYSKEYFLDSASYVRRLQEDLDHHNSRKAFFIQRRESLREDAENVNAFSIYDANWEAGTLSEIEQQSGCIKEQKALAEKLVQEQKKIRQEILEAKDAGKRLNDESNAIRNLLAGFERLLERLREEDVLYGAFESSLQKLRELTEKKKEKISIRNDRDSELARIKEKQKTLEETDCALQKGIAKVSDAARAEVVDGEWDSLLAQYEKLLEAQSADLKRLNDDKNRYLKEKEEKQKEITKRGCRQEEFEKLVYTQEQEAEAAARKKKCEDAYRDSETVLAECSRIQGKAESSLEGVVQRLLEYGGEALERSEVGKAFDSRIAEGRMKLAEIASAEKNVAAELTLLQKVIGKAESATEEYIRPAKIGSVKLETDCTAQLKALTKQIREYRNIVNDGRSKVENGLKKMASAYGSGSPDINLAIDNMLDLLYNPVIHGDRYYTLCEHMDANMHTAELRIAQIDTDLREFHKTRDDMIRQCMIQGRQMYEGLRQLSANSRVKVQGRRRQMIQFDIPEAIDENIAIAAIAAEIEKGTQAIVARMEEDAYSESEVRKLALRTVGSRRLLRKYTGSENIVLKAYKIDRNPDNSGYRKWEQTQVNNSGAEKFVVYFAVILALMAYTRDSYEDMGGKMNKSVLVLDNPFGPISSKHVLEPMFEISRNYNVQMICLSDISKSDVVTCFDLVIRAVVRQFALSNKEQLTHEGNETIEHGFYCAEQLSFF